MPANSNLFFRKNVKPQRVLSQLAAVNGSKRTLKGSARTLSEGA